MTGIDAKVCPSINANYTKDLTLKDHGKAVSCQGCNKTCKLNIDRWVNGQPVFRLDEVK